MPQAKETKQTRRSQEQRRRVTTNKLIEATIEAINEHGYAGLKASAITKKAGVTWGAVQHLFGEKESLLLTVANRTYEELSFALNADIPLTETVAERVSRLVDTTWRAYQSEAYLAMVEILRGSRSQTKFNRELLRRQQTVNEEVRNTWLRLFSDIDVPETAIDDAREMATLTLSGLAARRIFLRSENDPARFLGHLKESVLLILDSAGAQGSRTRKKKPDLQVLV